MIWNYFLNCCLWTGIWISNNTFLDKGNIKRKTCDDGIYWHQLGVEFSNLDTNFVAIVIIVIIHERIAVLNVGMQCTDVFSQLAPWQESSHLQDLILSLQILWRSFQSTLGYPQRNRVPSYTRYYTLYTISLHLEKDYNLYTPAVYNHIFVQKIRCFACRDRFQ